MNWLNRLLGRRAHTQHSAPRPTLRSSRPTLEMLEDRVQPSATSVVGAGFHGRPPAGSTLWFHSSFKATGVGDHAATIRVVNSSVDFTVKATKYHVVVPDATIVFSPTATRATTSFDVAAKAWNTTVPSSFKGDVFLSGVAWTVPAGLKGAIKNLKWKADFQTDTAGVGVKWHWNAETYKTLSSDYNALGVKAADGRHVTTYRNADPAGTPEAFRTKLVHGHGRCHSRFIGAVSGAKKVTPAFTTPPQQTTSLSGRVQLNGDTGLVDFAGVTVNLVGVNDLGESVSLSATTGADGRYSFGSLLPGSYTLTVVSPDGYMAESSAAGNPGGDSTSAEIANIPLASGQAGTGYDFVQKVGAANS